MRGRLWEILEDLEADAMAGLTVLTFEVPVSERASAAGLKVSSMVAVIVSHASEEEDRSYMRLRGLRQCLRRVL